MNKGWTLPVAIVAAGVIVAGAVYMSVPRAPVTPTGDPSLVRPVSASDHILGNPAAKVMIIEYADFDCEFCKGFNDVLKQVVASEGTGGSVALVFRHFPLVEIHQNALSSALAAECAAQVGGNDTFWKFTDQLYDHQPIDPTTYGSLAQMAGLGGDAFATCFSTASSTLGARIVADRQNALNVGAQGTPYSLIITTGKAPVVVNGAYG